MMKRKVVAMMMAVTLAAGMLSGCGSTVKTEDGVVRKYGRHNRGRRRTDDAGALDEQQGCD